MFLLGQKVWKVQYGYITKIREFPKSIFLHLSPFFCPKDLTELVANPKKGIHNNYVKSIQIFDSNLLENSLLTSNGQIWLNQSRQV